MRSDETNREEEEEEGMFTKSELCLESESLPHRRDSFCSRRTKTNRETTVFILYFGMYFLPYSTTYFIPYTYKYKYIHTYVYRNTYNFTILKDIIYIYI